MEKQKVTLGLDVPFTIKKQLFLDEFDELEWEINPKTR